MIEIKFLNQFKTDYKLLKKQGFVLMLIGYLECTQILLKNKERIKMKKLLIASIAVVALLSTNALAREYKCTDKDVIVAGVKKI